mmetsp:Transcript_82776/g.222015  ORF Transcript_82776/g.222015 Transcript_82776/m.222015 type:complete len:115 (+) Transcript_82776:133-477(+)
MRPFTFVLARTTALNAVDGTWAAADDPWGAYLTDPRVEQIGGGKNAFIGNHGTTWVPVDWNVSSTTFPLSKLLLWTNLFSNLFFSDVGELQRRRCRSGPRIPQISDFSSIFCSE